MKRVLGGTLAAGAIAAGMMVVAPAQEAQAYPGCVISWWDSNALGVQCSGGGGHFRIKALCKNGQWSPWGPWYERPGQAYAWCSAIGQQIANPNFNYKMETRG
ncbi:hypothetical protein [Nocardia huaxiensis]|uniref:Uncharacterized protein n=1 Tax=Nocardia huaxiensis TaxID=2755382 RepID=A0A7D6ZIB7_9NOCA|nr:hypothetical protein [Nocardia huaxiensis]QLY28623.1 hypothetical protein H0264_25190 [Nocardia huaxiensis]UFS97906.1 hypothetical protein LPY97_08405 [Nocardia huaxiensis]